MAANSLSPGYVVFNYTSNGHTHKQTVPVIPVAPAGPATNLRDSSGASQLWTSFTADWVLLLKPFFHTTDSIDSAEMWTQASPSSVPLLQDTQSIGAAGTSASPDVPWSQLKMSFKTTLGGKAFVQLMEGITGADSKLLPPTYGGATGIAAFLSYLTGASACPVGRDGAYIARAVLAVSKINDTLRKKYLVP